LVEELADIAVQWIVNLLLRPIDRNARARRDTLAPEIAELRPQLVNDRQALNRAMMDLYRRNNVSPFDGCTKKLLAHLIVGRLPTILSPRNQNLPELIAGTVLIVEPRHTPTAGRHDQR
jgi:membrane protein insertase Oxa1/YidC/SpoIIIJ